MFTSQINACLFVSIFILLITSCSITEIDSELQDFNIELAPITMIDMDMPGQVILRQGSVQNVVITAQEEVFQLINREIDNGIWVISLEESSLRFESVTISITLPQVVGLATSSTGDFVTESTFTLVDNLTIDVNSSGDIVYQGSASNINLEMNGNGNVELIGSTSFMRASMSGNGMLSGFDLVCMDIDMMTSGNGDAEVNAQDNLRVVMSGNGDIRYRGFPQIEQTITGNGELIDAN